MCKSATFKNDQMRTYLSNSLLSNEIICVSHQSGKLHSTSPLGFNSCTNNTKYGVGQISNVFSFRVSRLDLKCLCVLFQELCIKGWGIVYHH